MPGGEFYVVALNDAGLARNAWRVASVQPAVKSPARNGYEMMRVRPVLAHIRPRYVIETELNYSIFRQACTCRISADQERMIDQ